MSQDSNGNEDFSTDIARANVVGATEIDNMLASSVFLETTVPTTANELFSQSATGVVAARTELIIFKGTSIPLQHHSSSALRSWEIATFSFIRVTGTPTTMWTRPNMEAIALINRFVLHFPGALVEEEFNLELENAVERRRRRGFWGRLSSALWK